VAPKSILPAHKLNTSGETSRQQTPKVKHSKENKRQRTSEDFGGFDDTQLDGFGKSN